MSTPKFLSYILYKCPAQQNVNALRVTTRTFSTPNSRPTTGGGGGDGSLYPTTREKNFKNDAFTAATDSIAAFAAYANIVLSMGFQRARRTRNLLRANINKHETAVCAPTTTGLGRPFQTNYRSVRSDFYNFLFERCRLFDPFFRVGELYWNYARYARSVIGTQTRGRRTTRKRAETTGKNDDPHVVSVFFFRRVLRVAYTILLEYYLRPRPHRNTHTAFLETQHIFVSLFQFYRCKKPIGVYESYFLVTVIHIRKNNDVQNNTTLNQQQYRC